MIRENGMKKLKVTKLHGKFLAMNLLPIILMGLVITIFSANRFAASMYHEVQGGLMDLCNTIQVTIDELYPGAYHVEETEDAIYFMKGEHVLNGDYELIDSVKKVTNVDITLFYQDIRVATTLENHKGERAVGTQVSPVVKRDVLDKADDMFYSSVMVEDESYFAYYAPLFAEDGSCIGMIFVAQPSANVERLIRNSITPMVVIAILVMILVAFVTIHYTTGLVDTIKKIETYMANIAKGYLHDALDYEVLKRDDELGEMGRNAVRMQKSLRELVEEDTLTGLNNRRCGEKKLQQTYEDYAKRGISYCVALGDIDFFKRVNDTYGHDCGDVVLTEIAKRLK